MKTVVLIYVALVTSSQCQAGFVDPDYKISEWDGWGTRLGWWANVVGGLSDEIIEAITVALFSPDRLNLNIARYLIGATIPGDLSCGEFGEAQDVEVFKDGIDKEFIETRDSRARKILLAAKALGADTFEALAHSPPSWMTKSNCSKGNPDGAPLHDNFDPKYANAFADYLTDVVKFYHQKHNISFQYLSPFFEPSSGSWIGNNLTRGREGCNMELSTMAEVIKTTYNALQTKNLTFCHLSVAHEQNISVEIRTQRKLIQAGVDKFYAKVGAHSSKDEVFYPRSELFTLASTIGTKLWTNKFYPVPATRLPDMTQGHIIAYHILQDLRTLASSAWLNTEALSSLIGLPYTEPELENIVYHSGYYSVMQFSKHIKKGYFIVHISDEDCVAAHSRSSNKLVIVCVNENSTETKKIIDLSAFLSLGDVTAYRTSPFEPHVAISPPNIVLGHLNTDLAEDSITTFEISNARRWEYPNLIINGDFEATHLYPSAWFILYGERSDGGINGNYVYLGSYSGNVDYTETKLTLMQNIAIQNPKVYYLSAWCSASGDGVVLGILVNGIQAAEVEVLPKMGYRLYGISVDANEGDVLSIYLHSERGNHTGAIDDVALH